MLNEVNLIGRVGGAIKTKEVGGKTVANFSIATGKDKTTQWHYIVAWEKQASLCAQYLSKGKLVYIKGRLQTREWEDKQSGNKVSITEVVAHQVLFLSKNETKPDIDNVFPNADLSDFEDVPF